MRVLIVSLELPNMDVPVTSRAGRLGPLQRQIQSLRERGITIDLLPVAGRQGLKYLSGIANLRSAAARADVVHAHYGFCGWVARSQLQKPMVVSFMGSDVLRHRSNPRNVAARAEVCSNIILSRLADAVIVKSEEMARVIGTAAHVIPNGVDLARFVPTERSGARAKLGWRMDKPYVLFPGNPDDPTKDFRTAQQVIAKAETLGRRTIELVPLWGVSPQLVSLYMNASDVVLMTSLAEGSPNVIKEAMACNVPIASVPVGDVDQLLAGVRNCYVVGRNPESLAQAVNRLAHSSTRTDGRDRLLTLGLDLASVAGRIQNVYQLVLERHRKQFRGWPMGDAAKGWVQ